MAQSLYMQRYLEAVALWNADKSGEAIALAEHNLLDATLPRYLQMKNLLLMATPADTMLDESGQGSESARKSVSQSVDTSARSRQASRAGSKTLYRCSCR